MDIDLLSKMVKELILDEDRVILPGLGAFVAEIVPATFSDKGYTINPPYRRLYFRSKPDEGDELVTFYASSNNIEQDVAQRIIGDFLTELRSILHERKTVVFPGLGRLRATKENNLFFVADEDLDIYPEGFGLEPISLKTHTETRAQVAAAVVGLKSIMTEPSAQPQEPESVPAVSKEEVAEPVAQEPEVVPMIEIISVPKEEVVESEGIFEQPDKSGQSVVSEPIPEVESETVSQSRSVSVPEPISEPKVEAESDPVPVRKPSFGRSLMKVFVWMVMLAFILMLAFVCVSRINPELFDTILYTPEELEIVRTL